jgi:hypothetical protein
MPITVEGQHLYVVGAGTSADYNLPLGNRLKEVIASLVDFKFEAGSLKRGNGTIYESIHYGCAQKILPEGEQNKFYAAGRTISDAMPLAPSIDNFIEAHSQNVHVVTVAKLGIAKAILDAERHSTLWSNPAKGRGIDFKPIEKLWLNTFFRQLVEGANLERLARRLKQISFIVFNYDRCIEHFLHQAIQKYYVCSESTATELLSNLCIIHPYGCIGELPWQKAGSPTVAFGEDADWNNLLSISRQIQTLSEGFARESIVAPLINSAMQNATISSFLGFAFHPINMQFLHQIGKVTNHKVNGEHYSTGYQLSESNVVDIKIEIQNLFQLRADQVSIKNMTASSLLEEYSRRLALA